jgi:CubicO group peptidase (beta-lactamase class C family)
VVRGSRVVEEVSAGFAGSPEGAACTPDLRYQAGSISKLILSVVVLALTERHELNLDDPIGRWLGKMPPQWETITLHHLLSHTSGLGHWGDIPSLPTTFLTAPPARDDMVAMIRQAPLVHSPGAEWRYSGPGFLMAALVVEAATGASYGDVASDLVFAPANLRMTSSGHFPSGALNVAVGHHRGQVVETPAGFTQIPGTGDVWTTVDDLIRLNQALRAGQLLGKELVTLLWTPHALFEPTEDIAEDGPIHMDGYGYGTFLGRIKRQRAQIHPGDNPGYQSLLAYLPGPDLDLAVLCNEDPPSVDAAVDSLTAV